MSRPAGSAVPAKSPPAHADSRLWRSGWLWLAGGLLVLLGIADESFVALDVVLRDGGAAFGVIIAAALAGAWLPHCLGLGRAPLGDRYLLGAALGIGLLSLVVLVLGSLGWLTRPVALGCVVILGLAGGLRLVLDRRQFSQGSTPPSPTSEARLAASPQVANRGAKSPPSDRPSRRPFLSWDMALLLLAPCLLITLLAAALPPGILWQEEGWGYDALSYHLAVPKTWFEQGRISVLPDNVYSAMPFNGPMLWLLMMVLHGDAIDAVFMAQMVNVALGVLFVLAAWKLGSVYGRVSAVVAAVAAGTCPWVTYLCGIAYDEAGMLAMGMAALWAALKAGQAGGVSEVPIAHRSEAGVASMRSEEMASNPVEHQRGRWVIAAGLLAGLACGYKYTALPLIALPIGLLLVINLAGGWRRRAMQMAVYLLACLALLSPWLIRNQIATGNPIFPLGYSVFGAGPGWWDYELQDRWREAHGSALSELSIRQWIWQAGSRTLAEPRIGALLWALAVGGIFLRRDRLTLALIALLAMQLAVWSLGTHLFARFACVVILPLVALAARLPTRPMARRTAGLFAGVVVLGAVLNICHTAPLYYHHTRIGERQLLINAYGQTAWFKEGSWPGTQWIGMINDSLQGQVKVMLVGEARTFYLKKSHQSASAFNHHPLASAARQYTDDTDLLRWLMDRGVTHLLFHWEEISRLQTTYGLDGAINEGLLPRLEMGGVKQVASFRAAEDSPVYATLYEVPRP